MTGESDLIFVSMENWDEIWRRNQFLCAAFARRHPLSKVLFVGLSRDVSNSLRRCQLPRLRKGVTWTVPGLSNITVTHPVKLLPHSMAIGRMVNERLARQHIRRVALAAGIRDPLLWLNPHSAAHMAGRMGERAVIYDITDDWSVLSQSRPAAALVRKQDEALCRRADAVLVCSQKLFDLKCGLTDHLHLIPNGVDADHYHCVLNGTGRLPAAARAWEKPVLGYTGTIHPDRVDVNLIEAMSRQLGRGSTVLIGPNHLAAAETARLKCLGNVYLPGPMPYSELPNYMQAFDVCIVPHKVTPFTESLNPIKLWEYLAAGKPIVSTDVAGLRDYPQFVRIARNADDFVAAIQEGLGEDPSIADARRAEATKHSWTSRLDRIEAIFEECLKRTARSPSVDR